MDFTAGQQESAGSEVVEVRDAVIGDRLSVGGLFAAALHPTERAVGSHGGARERAPCFRHHRQMRRPRKKTLPDTPGQAVGEERGARKLRAAVVVGIHQAHIPETIDALQGEKAAAIS